MFYGKPHGGTEQSVQGKQLPCKKAKITVSATACQRGLFFLEIFVTPEFVMKAHTY